MTYDENARSSDLQGKRKPVVEGVICHVDLADSISILQARFPVSFLPNRRTKVYVADVLDLFNLLVTRSLVPFHLEKAPAENPLSITTPAAVNDAVKTQATSSSIQ